MTTRAPKRYYYIKARAVHRPSVKLVSARPVPAPATTLDMDFDAAAPAASISRVGVIWRLLLLGSVAAIMYVGGGLLVQTADNIKTDLTAIAARGVDKLEAAAAAITARDITLARDNFVAAGNLFVTAQRQLLALGQTNLYMSGLGDSRSTVITGQKLVDSGLHLALAGRILIDTMTPLWQYFGGLTEQPASPTDLATQVVNLMGTKQAELDRAIASVTKANALLASVNPELVGPEYAAAIAAARTKTAALERAVMTLGVLAKELPDALGFTNPRQYLVLNQNNNELRATGGFVGSYMLVEIYKGKLQSVLVDMTQRIDGQNPNPTLSLPEPLSAITTSFGTRDANWYLDFPTSARTFQKLYEQAGGGTADGIIAVNPAVIEDLLRILGPVQLAGRDLTLSADNFVTATQEQIEVVDKDTANPKAVLNEFAPILLERLLSATGVQIQAIGTAVTKRLNEKDILLYMRSPKLQSAFAGLSFAGALEVGTGDSLAVVRSNLGGRKSSQAVAEAITHTANINLTGDITDTLELTYTHTGTDVFPDGPNKDYIRVYVPKGTVRITAEGQDYGTEVETTEEGDLTVFGLWLTVDPGETKTATLNYRLPTRATDHYQLSIVKQPGTHNTALTSRVALSPALAFTNALGIKTKTLFAGELRTDLQFGVDISSVN